ncbi:MAG: alpha/beta hydrolase [Candidatus Sumerlaeota bacterium]|nr:alpha/beta hydrolase [Candidatus Sumerlaeota bacterium]
MKTGASALAAAALLGAFALSASLAGAQETSKERGTARPGGKAPAAGPASKNTGGMMKMMGQRPGSAPAGKNPLAKPGGMPGNLGSKVPPDFANVQYGAYDDDRLDLWKAKSDTPAPLLVFIHGGGFSAGSKSQFSPVLFDECMKAGVAFAAVEYRLSGVAQFPAQFHDCARAIQFLRANAAKYNIDPKRIACNGGSAGAGISVWLAFHDDMANPKSDDPVERESTRITCALVTGLQFTYDPREIRKIVPGNAYDVGAIKKLFGLPPEWNWDTDKVDADLDARLKEGSPVTHLTKDDAPVFCLYTEANNVPGNIHHANFGKYLKERMDKAGVECVFRMDSDYPGGLTEGQRDMARWMKEKFGLAPAASQPKL